MLHLHAVVTSTKKVGYCFQFLGGSPKALISIFEKSMLHLVLKTKSENRIMNFFTRFVLIYFNWLTADFFSSIFHYYPVLLTISLYIHNFFFGTICEECNE